MAGLIPTAASRFRSAGRRGSNPFLVVVLGLFVALGCAWVLFEVAQAVWFEEPILSLDMHVFRWLQGLRSAPADAFFHTVTRLGNPLALMVVAGAAALVLMLARRVLETLVLACGFAGVALMVAAIKSLFQRPRPVPASPIVQTFSAAFPSGHASLSVVVYVLLAYLLARSLGSLRMGAWLLAASIALSLAIGFSRLYLGVHWLSDVLAGYALAGLWLSLLVTGLETARRMRPAPALEQTRLRLVRRGAGLIVPATLLFLYGYTRM